MTNTLLDAQILRYVGIKTPAEIAETVGVEPSEVLRRYHQLINEIDALTIDQKLRHMSFKLMEIVRETQDRAANAIDEHAAGFYNATVQAIRELNRHLERAQEKNDEALSALNTARVQELLRLIDVVVRTGCAELAERHQIPEEELLGVFRRRLRSAAEEIEA